MNNNENTYIKVYSSIVGVKRARQYGECYVTLKKNNVNNIEMMIPVSHTIFLSEFDVNEHSGKGVSYYIIED